MSPTLPQPSGVPAPGLALGGHLLPELIRQQAARQPDAPALQELGGAGRSVSYGELQQQVQALAHGLLALGLPRGQRVGIYLDKRLEAVVASFAAPAAGAVFVPLNPVLKAAQVGFILQDCAVQVLVTSRERLAGLAPVLGACPALRHVVLVEGQNPDPHPPASTGPVLHRYADLLDAPPAAAHRVVDQDMAAILYTSGSTGQPKGVVLSHRNLVAGAHSVASYLGNGPQDRLLAALPLSFDAGFSQLTTAFASGASVALLNVLLPRDVLKALEAGRITGLTAVPPLYIQLAQLDWPEAAGRHLRYFANTGGHLPRETLDRLRQRLPRAQPFLMYGLTEAFRSTYLPPQEVDRRPDSIGQAIPNAEILVLREDGSPCGVDEPGELVHRGALVSLGYWNDPARTAERFRPLPAGVGGREAGLTLPELAVFSGDTVRRDADGFLYFVGRRDEMIKTSGYRVSPTEVEEALYATGLVGECVAFGVPHAVLGQAIQVVATPPAEAPALDLPALQAALRARLPAYQLPQGVAVQAGPLPRNPNGKIDRKRLSAEWMDTHAHA